MESESKRTKRSAQLFRDLEIQPDGSGPSGESDKGDHVNTLWDVNQDRLYDLQQKLFDLQQKISEQPILLRTSAALSSCCVFRVPRSFIDVNGKAYQPHIVSIGPYHHGWTHLQMFQEHKWRYVGSLISRTVEAKGLGLADYLKSVQPLESKARDCYSESIGLTVDEFVEMMVLDGCFVIELFRKHAGVVPVKKDDPIFSMSWVRPCLARDLLKLENQIPLFVLQFLFDLSKIPGAETETSLASLALTFFNEAIPMPGNVLAQSKKLAIPMPENVRRLYDERAIPKPENVISEEETDASPDKCPKHLLDFLRSSFIPNQEPLENSKSGTRMIPCVTKLRRAGIKCKSNTGDSPPKNSFLDIKFRKNGVIEMPALTIDDVTSTFLLNCVAYEQCYRTPSKRAYVTTYVTFMDCLIDTPEDVGLLCDGKVIDNYLGDDAEVAKFFNECGKDVAVNINKGYLSKVFDDIDEYYRKNWNVHWATFLHTYFDSPWSFISAIAAVVLLLLTFTQTFFAAYDHFK